MCVCAKTNERDHSRGAAHGDGKQTKHSISIRITRVRCLPVFGALCALPVTCRGHCDFRHKHYENFPIKRKKKIVNKLSDLGGSNNINSKNTPKHLAIGSISRENIRSSVVFRSDTVTQFTENLYRFTENVYRFCKTSVNTSVGSPKQWYRETSLNRNLNKSESSLSWKICSVQRILNTICTICNSTSVSRKLVQPETESAFPFFLCSQNLCKTENIYFVYEIIIWIQ